MATVITTHKNMDLDALGALVGAKKLFPEGVVVLPETKGEEVIKLLKENPNTLSFIEEKDFKGEVEKLIIVDTSSTERIPESIKRKLKENAEVVIYDHHPKEEIEGVEIHHKEAGATTSIITLLLKGKGLVPDPYEASVMLAGIYSDTGSFTYPSTTPLDFLAAAYLISVGAQIEFVRKYLPKELSEKEIDTLKVLKDNLQIAEVHGNRIGITYGRFDTYVGDVAPLINKLMELYSLPAIFGVIELQSTVFLIGRSRSEKVRAERVVEPFGGGGHKEAASASIKGKTVFEVLEELREVLERAVEPLRKAEDIMTFPPITVKEGDSVEEARTTLMKNGINAAAVVNENGEIEGIVNRKLLDKAVYMGLKEAKVEEVMEREFKQVNPKTPINQVEKIIVENQQSFIPVVKGKKVVGVITRTDILLNLYREEIKESSEFYRRRSFKEPAFRNVKERIRGTLPKELLTKIERIGEIADRLNVNAYIVGGFVRDLIIGRKNYDVDIVIEGDATEFAKAVGKELGAKVHTFSRFKTATLTFKDGTRIDLASARTEVYRSPGALPEVDTAPLKKDLMRRDFTINTLAVKINKREFGKLIDFFGGLKDIKDKKVRVLHSLSFVEDPTRILRALRFATRYRFTLGRHTERLLKIAVERHLFKTVEGQRIYHELKQILSEENPLRVFINLEKYGVLKELFPKVKWDRKKKDLFERIRKLVIWHKFNFEEIECNYPIIYLSALFLGEEKEEVEKYVRELSLPKKEEELLREITFKAHRVIKELKRAKTPSEVYKVLKGKPEELLLLTAALKEEVREKVIDFMKRSRWIKLLVGGNDIKELGVKPGAVYKELLEKLKLEVIDGKVRENDFAKQKERLKEMVDEIKSREVNSSH